MIFSFIRYINMNPGQLILMSVVVAMVVVIVIIVIRYEIRARKIRGAYEEASKISQDIAGAAAADPIVGQWAYTDVSLGGLKSFDVDGNFVLVGDMYGSVQLMVKTPGLYTGVFRAGDPPTTISVIGDTATIGTQKFVRIKR